MSKNRRIKLIAISAAAVLLASAAPARAHLDRTVTSDEAEAASIRVYAESTDQTFAQVSRFVEGQGEFGQVADQIRQAFPNDYVAAVWDGPSSAKTAIYVKLDVISKVETLYPTQPIRASRGLSEKESDALTTRIVHALDKIPQIVPASVGIVRETGEVSIEYMPVRSVLTADASLPDRIARVVDPVIAGTSISKVTITQASGLATTDGGDS